MWMATRVTSAWQGSADDEYAGELMVFALESGVPVFGQLHGSSSCWIVGRIIKSYQFVIRRSVLQLHKLYCQITIIMLPRVMTRVHDNLTPDKS